MKNVILLLFLSLTFLNAQIAKVTAIKGDVLIKRAGQYKIAKLNSAINKLDVITTEKNARIQLVFSDNTIISIGKNSTFSIKDYLFDIGKKPKISLKFGYGTFKSITGKIGKLNPKGFKLESKTATMGIRGTIINLDLNSENEIYLVPEGKIELKIGNQIIIINAGEMVTRKKDKPAMHLKSITKKIRDELEEKSGAHDNESESGLGEKTQTTEVNSVEKCNYR